MAVTALGRLRVLDLADESGAYCGKLLADLGADVVKIEPPGGDAGRLRPPLWNDASSGSLAGLRFLYWNTSKRSLVLDLDESKDRDRLLVLVAAADLVVESGRPGELESVGLGYETLRAANPRVVLTSITGFGQTGPHRDFRSSDLIANAMGGTMYVTGEAEDPPVNLAGAHSQVMASTCAAASSMMALRHAERTGHGQHVDISAQEVVASVCHIAGTGKWRDDGIVPRRMGSGLFASIPSGAYSCSDGLVYLMVNRPGHWQALARWIAEETGEQAVLESIFEGPSANRFEHRELVDHFVGELTRRHTVQEMFREGQRRHLSFTPVNRICDVMRDEHLRSRGFFIDLADRRGVSLRHPGVPYRSTECPARVRFAPEVGEGGDAAEREWRPRVSEGDNRSATPRRCQPLDDLRVVEFTAGMAGPWIGRFMAYHGADVIKVESTARPDVTRQYISPSAPDAGVQSQLSPWLTDWNAGKRCVALDLTHPDAAALAIRLVKKADVVIENYATGVMEKLGLTYDVLREANPELVMLSTTGFGDSGPYRRFISWGPNLEAASGLSSLSGFPWRQCTMTQYAYPDSLSALHGLFAVLAALRYRSDRGQGQNINLSQLEATVAVIGDVVMETLAGGSEPELLANGSSISAPHGCYRCAGEDRWVAIAVFGDEDWRALCGVIGEPSMAREPRFDDFSKRQTNRVEIDARIGNWSSQRDARDAMNLLQAAGVAAGVVQTAQDKFEKDPHLRERGFFETIPHDIKGNVVADGIPTGLAGELGGTSHAGRAIGADNESVFVELVGLTPDELARHVASGAIEAAGQESGSGRR